MKTITLLVTIILLTSIVYTASAQPLTLQPSTFNIKTYGGETINKTISLTRTNNTPLFVFIQTDISPDGKGIGVTYSSGDFFLLCKDTEITMTIKLAPNIKPDTYIIHTNAWTINPTDRKTIEEYKTILENVTNLNITNIEGISNETLNKLLDFINKTRVNAGNATTNETIKFMQDIINYLINEVNETHKTVEDMTKIVAIVILTVLVGLISYIIFTKKREEMKGGEKE